MLFFRTALKTLLRKHDPINELIPQAQKGDEGAIRELWRYIQFYILRFLVCRTRNEDIGHDLCQVAGFEILKALRRQTRPIVDFQSFCLTIASNIANDYFRRSYRDPLKGYVEYSQTGELTANFEESRRIQEEIEYVRAALNKLPDRDRKILFEYYFNGQTQQDIGRSMNLSRNRVGQILDKSRKRLKAIFERERYY